MQSIFDWIFFFLLLNKNLLFIPFSTFPKVITLSNCNFKKKMSTFAYKKYVYGNNKFPTYDYNAYFLLIIKTYPSINICMKWRNIITMLLLLLSRTLRMSSVLIRTHKNIFYFSHSLYKHTHRLVRFSWEGWRFCC